MVMIITGRIFEIAIRTLVILEMVFTVLCEEVIKDFFLVWTEIVSKETLVRAINLHWCQQPLNHHVLLLLVP
jgi:hypothetical protein